MAEETPAAIRPLPMPEPVPTSEPKSCAPAWVPTLLLHVFYPDSRKAGWGYQLSIWSTYGCFFARFNGQPILDSDRWFLCQLVAGVIIGGGTIADAWISAKIAPQAPKP